MANKKKKSGSKSRKTTHRRVGAVSSGITNFLALLGGAVLGRTLYNVATKPNATTGKPMLDPKLASGGLAVVGGFAVPHFVKGDMVKFISYGAGAMNGVICLQNLGAIKGLPSSSMVAGNLPASNMVSGIPAQVHTMSSMAGMTARKLAVDEC